VAFERRSESIADGDPEEDGAIAFEERGCAHELFLAGRLR
jgi:hypothetical protein